MLILPFFEGQAPAFSAGALSTHFKEPFKAGDFKGNSEELLYLYPTKNKEARLLLIGLGAEKQLTKEEIRCAYGKAINWLKGKAESVNVQIPETSVLKEGDLFSATAEGILLGGYIFDANKTQKEKPIQEVTFIGGGSKQLKRVEAICSSVCYARDMVFQNADTITPTFLGHQAMELASDYASIKTTVFNRSEIIKNQLGLLAAVGRSAAEEPAFIIIEYRGAPNSQEKSAIVGKGITYDTGGLNIKTAGMETMRDDMSGAAAVLGALRAAAELKLAHNIIGVIASTENAIGPTSYKPGDVYKGYAGITVEITNTDAEGRLVLADAISYVQKNFAPKRIIDIATLTGGCVVALGDEVSGLMCNDDKLAEELIEAGERTYERLCRLPLYREYQSLLKSKVADIKNSGVRKASPIQGGIFLQKFVEKTSWAHIDIAGTAFPESPKPYQPVQATGVGVRLFIEFFEMIAK